jgi:hypothetical protein
MPEFFRSTLGTHEIIRKSLVGKITLNYEDNIIRFYNMDLKNVIVIWHFPNEMQYVNGVIELMDQLHK